MTLFRGAYVAGRFLKVSRRTSLSKVDPGNTERIIGNWCATLDSVEAAVDAAARAYDAWPWLPPAKRFDYLRALQRVFKKRQAALAEMISSEMGKPLVESQSEVTAAINKIDVTLRQGMRLLQTVHRSKNGSYYSFHPRGVLVMIGPFNFPLHLPNANWTPALASGNPIIFKPSEFTPFTGQLIAECFHEARFPKGVFNLVQGSRKVGEALVNHPDVKGVLFVGSDATGKAILQQTQQDPNKICVLEMGGKNAALVFDDANLTKAVHDCVQSAFMTSGQRCNALSRVIVHAAISKHFIKEFLEQTLKWRIGYFQDTSNQMGPLVSEAALKRFLRYQKMARKEGARTLLHGRRRKREHPGYYVSPAIHRIEETQARKQKVGYRYDEIFGPDIAIYTFERLEEAIRLHNDSRYGLVASVFTKRKSLFNELYRYLEIGNLHWNRPTIGTSSLLPFGGVKASGNNFPAGLFSPYYCTYPVAVQI